MAMALGFLDEASHDRFDPQEDRVARRGEGDQSQRRGQPRRDLRGEEVAAPTDQLRADRQAGPASVEVRLPVAVS